MVMAFATLAAHHVANLTNAIEIRPLSCAVLINASEQERVKRLVGSRWARDNEGRVVPSLGFFSFRVDPLLLEQLGYSGLLERINKTPLSERVSAKFFGLHAVPCEDFRARKVINPTWHECCNPATASGHGIPNNMTDCLVRDVSHSTGQCDQIYLPHDLNERLAWLFI